MGRGLLQPRKKAKNTEKEMDWKEGKRGGTYKGKSLKSKGTTSDCLVPEAAHHID
jgi:hypothetical protein